MRMSAWAFRVLPYRLWLFLFGTPDEQESDRLHRSKKQRNKIELAVGKVMFDPEVYDIWTTSRIEADIEYMTGVMHVEPDPIFMGWADSKQVRQDSQTIYTVIFNNQIQLYRRSQDQALLIIGTSMNGDILWVAKLISATLYWGVSWYLVIQPIADRRMAQTFDWANPDAYECVNDLTQMLHQTTSLSYDEDVQSRARRTYLRYTDE